MSTPAEKQHAHELIERIPADQLSTIVRFMEPCCSIQSPGRLPTRRVDSQPVSDEEAAAFDQAHGAIGRGEGISHEDILKSLLGASLRRWHRRTTVRRMAVKRAVNEDRRIC